ncbi:hypothetical protein [Alkalihalobacillus sp. 1P02AB]|uniref:hypothetical protein n=1 Tax=Alkalihalobacillus sp. 1P02AB TaxID=3132260 RepID=UPI0039A43D3A
MANQLKLVDKETLKSCHTEAEYYENSYTLIGLKDYLQGTRITPSVSMKLGQRREVSLAAVNRSGAFIRYNNGVIKELKKGYLPIVLTDVIVDEALQYQTEMFVGPIKNAPFDGMDTTEKNYLNYLRLRMKNKSGTKETAEMKIEITEHFSKGVPSFRPIELKDDKTHWIGYVNGKILFLLPKQVNVHISVENSTIVFTSELDSGEESLVDVRFVFALVNDADKLRPDVGHDTARLEVEQFWEDFLNEGTQLSIPHKKAIHTLKASIIYTFMTRDRGEIHPGVGFYDRFWTRDAAFINYSVQMLNFTKQAFDTLASFWERTENEDGSLMSHRGQLDGTGQGLWGLYQYYMLSRDAGWLNEVYPRLKKAADWIVKTRRKDLPVNDPYFGLMPNSLADGECLWNGEYHIVGYDLWSLRGLICFSKLAQYVGKEEDAATYLAEFKSYKQDVLKALERSGVNYFPPSYELKGTHWSNIKSVFPYPVFDAFDSRVLATMEEAEKTFVEGVCSWDGAEEDMGEVIELPMKAIHPYMSTYVTQTRLLQGDYKKVAEHFDAMLEHTTSTHGFPEGIFNEYRLAWNDTLPHIYGHATYIILLRRMLIHEEEQSLHLGLGTPCEWFSEGDGIHIHDALTEFGAMSYEAVVEGKVLHAKIIPPKRNDVSEIIFYLPPNFAKSIVKVNGQKCEHDGRKLKVPSHIYNEVIKIEAHQE